MIQEKSVQRYLRSAAETIMAAYAFEKTALSPSLSLIAAAACDGSNWTACGKECEETVLQRERAHTTPMFKLYVGNMSSLQSFAQYGIKAIARCCDTPINCDDIDGDTVQYPEIRGIRFCEVGCDSSVTDIEDVLEQRAICLRNWPAVMALAQECRLAGVSMLLISKYGNSRSGSVAALCLAHLQFPGCTSILASHTIVGEARPCVQSCNPGFLRWAQEFLDAQRPCEVSCTLRSYTTQFSREHAALSWLLLDGKVGVHKNFNKAFEVALEGNRLNCLHSKGALARCYFTGRGVEKDLHLGIKLARESAASGSCYGHFVLGTAYLRGEGGTNKDDTQAVAHWRLAAKHGLASAQFNLGTMYSNGHGTVHDHAEAVRLYRLAAAQDYSPAQYSLGYIFENGLGVPADDSQAMQWYHLASMQSDGEYCSDAKSALSRLKNRLQQRD